MAGFNKGERGVKCVTVKNIDEMRGFFPDVHDADQN